MFTIDTNVSFAQFKNIIYKITLDISLKCILSKNRCLKFSTFKI